MLAAAFLVIGSVLLDDAVGGRLWAIFCVTRRSRQLSAHHQGWSKKPLHLQTVVHRPCQLPASTRKTVSEHLANFSHEIVLRLIEKGTDNLEKLRLRPHLHMLSMRRRPNPSLISNGLQTRFPFGNQFPPA